MHEIQYEVLTRGFVPKTQIQNFRENAYKVNFLTLAIKKLRAIPISKMTCWSLTSGRNRGAPEPLDPVSSIL